MKILAFNSNLDNAIVMFFVIATATFFILKWIRQRLVSMRFKIHSFQNENLTKQISNYIFNFENSQTDIKPYSVTLKLVSIFLSVIIITVPLYEVITTINPYITMYIGFTCLV